MSDKKPAVVSKTKVWPNRQIIIDHDPARGKTNGLGEPLFFLSTSPKADTQITYRNDGSALWIENGKVVSNMEISAIKSIQLQSRNEYYGTPGGNAMFLDILRSHGGKKFAENVGVSYDELEQKILPYEWLFLLLIGIILLAVFSLFLFNFLYSVFFVKIVTYLGGGYVEGDYGAWEKTWWFDKGLTKHHWAIFAFFDIAISLAITALPIVAAVRLFQKHKPEELAAFRYSTSFDYYVVVYLSNGKRFVVASVYRNKSLAIEMLTDHQNALDAALLANVSQAKSGIEDEQESKYI